MSLSSGLSPFRRELGPLRFAGTDRQAAGGLPFLAGGLGQLEDPRQAGLA